jgi:hypothetical protein
MRLPLCKVAFVLKVLKMSKPELLQNNHQREE